MVVAIVAVIAGVRGASDHISLVCNCIWVHAPLNKNTYCGKFWKRWEYQTTWPASWETCMQVRKQQLELDLDQQTGSK